MGYTHYWYRPTVIRRETFRRIVGDFKQLLPEFGRAGVQLAGPFGKGEPVLTDEAVVFNGNARCGHPRREIIAPWPEPNAGGVFSNDNPVSGMWYVGHTLTTRACDGNYSFEAFVFERVYRPQHWETEDEDGWFECCKTAFRPYDLAVTAFLVIAKHHLGRLLTVKSDGHEPHWRDAVILCRVVLGYGDFPFAGAKVLV